MKFNKAPTALSEKEKKAEDFLNFKDSLKLEEEKNKTPRKVEKEEMKPFPLRIPETLFYDIKEIAGLTGISMNAICLDILRPAVKRKLKDIKEDNVY